MFLNPDCWRLIRRYLDLQGLPVDFWGGDVVDLPELQGAIGGVSWLDTRTSVEAQEHLCNKITLTLLTLTPAHRLTNSLFRIFRRVTLKKNVRVHGEFVQVVVLVEGKVLPQVEKLLQGFINKYDTYEWGEGFLCEPRDVTHKGTGVGRDQEDTEEGCPQTDTGPQGQIGQAVLPVWRKEKGKGEIC